MTAAPHIAPTPGPDTAGEPVVTVTDLVAKGAVRKNQPVKVLGSGEISVALNITADKFSASASEKIAAAGGSTQNA